MDTKELYRALSFFESIIPAHGQPFLVRGFPKENGKKGLYFRNEAAANSDDFINRAAKLVGRFDHSEYESLYFTPFSFKEPYQTRADGKRVSNRHASNAAFCKCFFCDVDCGENKPFSTKEKALQALAKFCTDAKFPTPTCLVDSGGGYHAYWIFSEEIDAIQWKDYAERLKALMHQHGFHADPAVTADAARFLRLPGSVNLKHTDARLVTLKGFNANKIKPFQIYTEQLSKIAPRPTLPSKFTDEVTDKMLSGLDSNSTPKFTKYIIPECPLMQKVALDHGKSCSEPLWVAVLQLIFHTEDGAEHLHILSDGHPGYDVQECEQKYIERNNDAGPTTCEHFKTLAAGSPYDSCSNCPHLGKFKSPIALGYEKMTTVISTEIPVPFGYSLQEDGVYSGTEGEYERVVDTRISDLQIFDYEDITGDWNVRLKFKFFKDREYTAEINQKSLSDAKTTYTACVGQRLVLKSKREKEGFMHFMNSWVDTLRQAGMAHKTTKYFGWKFEGRSPKAFSVGSTSYYPDGTETAAFNSGDNINSYYTPTGDPEPWRKAAELLEKQGQPEFQAIIATAFAAPLIVFTGTTGAMLSVVSARSGVGKSSAIKLAEAVWGDPIRTVNALDDTHNAVIHKLSRTCDMPAYWDELRLKNDVQNFIKLTFQLSQGKEKSRLDAGANAREVRSWRTLMMCASNVSLMGALDDADAHSDAGVLRILEYNIEDVYPIQLTPMRVAEHFSALENNYGHVGREYAKWLIMNHALAKQTVSKVMDRLDHKLAITQDERFWAATVASLLAGATLAKHLHLFDFDIEKLQDFLLNVLSTMRHSHIEVNTSHGAADIVAEYVRTQAAYALVTTTMPIGRGRFNRDGVRIMQIPRDERTCNYQISKDDMVLRVPRSTLHRWLKQHGINALSFVANMQSTGILLRQGKFRLGVGTPYEHGSELCYDIQYRGLHLAYNADDAGETAEEQI